MNRIWSNHSRGLNIQENNDYSLLPPAPPKKVILKDIGIRPPPLKLVPVVSSLLSHSTMKKRPAPPPPPLKLVPVVSSLSSHSTMKKRPAPPPPPLPLNLVPVLSCSSSQSIIKKRPAPPPPTNSRASFNTYYDFKNNN
ncbi:unnamed protein product [Adineta steineri]|uniref:Uncharacterized protein n=1 Tax=Adineta steineri TaxID=433720 RepID=A0A816A9S4_9BILA|nr:unnamed protein product [Adineta steineri]CAF1680336.1 unnamed protein product [Adineta steineri]